MAPGQILQRPCSLNSHRSQPPPRPGSPLHWRKRSCPVVDTPRAHVRPLPTTPYSTCTTCEVLILLPPLNLYTQVTQLASIQHPLPTSRSSPSKAPRFWSSLPEPRGQGRGLCSTAHCNRPPRRLTSWERPHAPTTCALPHPCPGPQVYSC